MKSAYHGDIDSIREIFKYWLRKGFVKELDEVLFFLEFVLETHEVTEEGLTKMLEESDLKGGETMQTLADRFREEGLEKGREEGREEERKRAEEEKLNTARELVKNGVDMRIISRATGFSFEQIEKLVTTVN